MTLPENFGQFPLATEPGIYTFDDAPGIPAGLQFAAVFQSLFVLPVQVCAGRKIQENVMRKNMKTFFITSGLKIKC
jgi:hypothetical protein